MIHFILNHLGLCTSIVSLLFHPLDPEHLLNRSWWIYEILLIHLSLALMLLFRSVLIFDLFAPSLTFAFTNNTWPFLNFILLENWGSLKVFVPISSIIRYVLETCCSLLNPFLLNFKRMSAFHTFSFRFSPPHSIKNVIIHISSFSVYWGCNYIYMHIL